MRSQLPNDKWQAIRARDCDFLLILASLAVAKGIRVGKRPRTRSVILLECGEREFNLLIQQAKRIATCVEYCKLEAIESVLAACGAVLPPPVSRHLALLEARIAVDPELAALEARAGQSGFAAREDKKGSHRP